MKKYKILETMAAPTWFLKKGDIVDKLPEGVGRSMYEIIEVAVASKSVQTATRKKRVTKKKKVSDGEN